MDKWFCNSFHIFRHTSPMKSDIWLLGETYAMSPEWQFIRISQWYFLHHKPFLEMETRFYRHNNLPLLFGHSGSFSWSCPVFIISVRWQQDQQLEILRKLGGIFGETRKKKKSIWIHDNYCKYNILVWCFHVSSMMLRTIELSLNENIWWLLIA